MRIVRELAEEYWAEVGVTVLIAGALAISVVLAVAFNIISTRQTAAQGVTSLSTSPVPSEPVGIVVVVAR